MLIWAGKVLTMWDIRKTPINLTISIIAIEKRLINLQTKTTMKYQFTPIRMTIFLEKDKK